MPNKKNRPRTLQTRGHVARQARERAGFTQASAAEAWEIGVRTIRDIESGKGASGTKIQVFAEKCGITNWHDLLTDDARASLGIPPVRGRLDCPISGDASGVRDAAVTPGPQHGSGPVGAIPLRQTKLVGRDRLLEELIGLLRGFATGAGGSDRHVVSLQGMPGLGKTAVAVAVAHHPAIQEAFTDGVYWQSMGKRAEPLAVVTRWCDRLAGPWLLEGLERVKGAAGEDAAAEAGGRLRAFLLRTGKRALFILDDVWHPAHVAPILIAGGVCGSLITTRQLPIAEEFAPHGHRKRPARLSPAESLDLLADLVGSELVAEHRRECDDLVGRLDGLPLALTVAGRLLARDRARGHPVADRIREIRERTGLLLAEPAPADMRQFLTDVENPNVVAVLQLSTDELDDRARECFAVLGDVAPANEGIFPLSMMAAGWALTLEEARAVADQLVEAGLIQPAKQVGKEVFYYMHDLLIQHAKTMIEPRKG